MSHPLSVRFRDAQILDRLKTEARARKLSTSALAEELMDEGLRLRRHPLVVFRDGATGRRAGLVGGPDIWELINGLVGGDVPIPERMSRAIELFGLSAEQVGAAFDYYAEFPEEIDGEVAANVAAAEEAETIWRRRQELIAG